MGNGVSLTFRRVVEVKIDYTMCIMIQGSVFGKLLHAQDMTILVLHHMGVGNY